VTTPQPSTPEETQRRLQEREQLVAQIAMTLGETDLAAIRQLRRIVRHTEAERALTWLTEALAIETAGGQMLPDGSRRRTPGGVYFRLVRQQLTPQERSLIFPSWAAKHKGRKKRTTQPAPSSALAPTQLPSTKVERVVSQPVLLPEVGKASSVKITLIGRPGRLVEKQQLILTTMENERAPSLPKGLPAPPTTPTTYTLYIAAKQWRAVEAAMADPADALIVEGWAAYDPELEGVAVWATSCTTKLLQRAKREGQSPPVSSSGDTGVS